MKWKAASRIVFALTFIAIGLASAASASFAPVWQPVPETTPVRQLLEWLTDLVAISCGAGLLFKRTQAGAALILLIFLAVWTALFKVPFILQAPLQEVSYQSNGENLVLVAAAWVLFGESTQRRNFLVGALGWRIAYLLYGLALIAFGLSHFFYLELTAPLVPTWLPSPVLWAYATGAIYIICGIAIATFLAPKWGALAAAIQITLITLLVWGPMVATRDLSAEHWQETVVSWALTAAAFVLATGSPPTRAGRRVLSR